MTFETLTTERLILRKLTPEDYQMIFETYPDDQIMQFLHIEDIEKLAIEKEKQRKGRTTYNRTFLTFQLLDKQTHEIIGGCGFHTWYVDHARAEIGYGLNYDDTKGKGFMTEALEAVINYGFDAMQLNRIEAYIGPNNIASRKLVEKFGFVQEGQLRQHYSNKGKLEDSVVYGLLRENYRKTI